MKPGLLLNENFPEPASAVLRQMGWNVVAVSERMPGANDFDVLALATRENRWLITFDMDYGDLIFRNRLPPPPVVLLLRVPPIVLRSLLRGFSAWWKTTGLPLAIFMFSTGAKSGVVPFGLPWETAAAETFGQVTSAPYYA